MTDAKAPAMTKLSELVSRLRRQAVICKGETFKIDVHDGRGPQDVTTGDIVQIRNPDGPEAADAIERLERENAELREELEHFVDIVDGTDDTGFDPHVEQMLMDAADSARASLSPSVEKGE